MDRAKKVVIVYGTLFVVSISFLIASYFVPKEFIIGGIPWSNELLKQFVSEIGIAGLVGFILALTIERLSAEEFRKLAEEEREKIKQDVFHYVYGRHIPETVRNEIDKQILEVKFARQHFSLFFTLSVLKDETGKSFILSETRLEYELKNLTTEAREQPLWHYIDLPPGGALKELVKYTAVEVTGCKNPIKWNEEDLKSKQFDEGLVIALKPTETITVESNASARVMLRYQGVRNFEGGRIDFTFPNYTCDLNLTVHVPDREVIVSAKAYSPNPLEEGRQHDPLSGLYNWVLSKPLLSYQGVYVTWHPADDRPTGVEQKAPS